jgi:hypothetical protein
MGGPIASRMPRLLAETVTSCCFPAYALQVMTRGKKVLFALLLAFAVSTTSVSCLPISTVTCPAGGGPVGC